MRYWLSCALLIVAIFGVHFISLAAAQTADQTELMRRLQTLEQRVDRIEKRGGASPQSSKQSDRAAWRNISRGMSMDQVRDLLGEAHKINTNSYFTTWYWNYPSGGSVTFDASGMVDDISEP